MALLQSNFQDESTISSAFIDLRHIKLTYELGSRKLEILNDLNLSIAEGEFICVLGPSGCGKSTLLKILAGYEIPEAGEIIIDGKTHQGPNAEIGVVFQHANLFPWLSIEKNVEFGLKMKKMSKTQRRQLVSNYLDMVGLKEFATLLPHQLSGGMKQRAAIARSLVMNPKIILTDEPFAALDSITRQSIQGQLKQLWQQTNKTIFFITHDVDEAIFLGSRVILLNGKPGKVMLDCENPLASKVKSESDFRDVEGYKEFRQTLMKALEK